MVEREIKHLGQNDHVSKLYSERKYRKWRYRFARIKAENQHLEDSYHHCMKYEAYNVLKRLNKPLPRLKKQEEMLRKNKLKKMLNQSYENRRRSMGDAELLRGMDG